jgi:uncharacterized protein
MQRRNPDGARDFLPYPPATMKLHADVPGKQYLITAHGPGWLAVNGHRVERSLLVMPDRLDSTWGPAAGEVLAAAHLATLATRADLAGHVLLLGTGSRQQFPPPQWLRPLVEAGIGLEIMDTGAACRTYNILVAEGRAVAAALVVA